MKANDSYERELWAAGIQYVCGSDECGTGSLASVAATASVVFPQNFDYKALLHGLNDSKQLTPEKREALYPLIKQHALAWAVDFITLEEITDNNIYWAKWISVRRAIGALSIRPEHILMDGNKVIPDITIPQTAIVKGDAKSFSIAAASVLAKVDRDRHMVELAKNVHPDYGWAENKGYYTDAHVAAIKKHGKTVYHRDRFVSKFITPDVKEW
jgi:ribonuclease HII